VAAWAQSGKVVRIGFLSPASASDPRMLGLLDAFRRGLVELGYVEGRAFRIESRWAEGRYERLPRLAAELVASRVDVILTVAVPAIRAAMEATRTIPIVMASVVDPVATGLVVSLARPGGNITGLSNMAPDVTGKLLEILKQVVPNASRVAVLWNPGNPGNAPQLRAAEAAGQALGIRLQALEARTPDDLDPAFAAMARQRAEALLVFADVMLNEQRARIASLAAAGRLPAVYGQEGPAGGLITYSANTPDLFRRSATYVDRIVKGAKPGDLPVEQATRFDLVIDLKAARALGLTIPQSLLLRADQVIE
jgi:putative ABC transport system substrate-binding protein